MRAAAALAFTALLLWGCPDPVEIGDAGTPDAGPAPDAADPPADAGGPAPDAGTEPDSGVTDAGTPDTGLDAGSPDTGPAPFPITVAYSATATQDTLLELFLTDTSTSRRAVHGPLAGRPAGGEKQPETGGITRFFWLPDGSGIMYEAQEETFDFTEIHLTQVRASRPRARRKISLPAAPSPASGSQLSPGRAYVTFTQQGPGDDRRSQYLVPYDTVGAAPIRVSQGLPLTTAWDPTGRYLYFQDIIGSADDRDLWLVDATAYPMVATARVNPGANIGFGRGADFDAAGARIAYTADERASRVFELYVADVAGTSITNRTRMHPAFPPNADIPFELDAVQFSPDGDRLAFTNNATSRTLTELTIVDVTQKPPPPQVTLTGNFPKGASGVQTFDFSPDGTRILYVADQDTSGAPGLYVSDTTGAPPVEVHPGPGVVLDKVWDDRLAYFRVATDGVARLYVADLSALPPAAPVQVSDLADGEAVNGFSLSPSGRQLVYRTRREADDGAALHWVDLSDPSVPRVVPLGETARNGAWCWAPDDRLAAVLADPDDGTGHLYLVEDPAAPTAQRISGPIVPGTRVFECAFPPTAPTDT